jgi:putative endonuclease
MTNFTNNVFYIGVTNDLIRRTYEHKNKLVKGFTQRYNLTKLVYYEVLNEAITAIEREKQLKNKSRIYKINLIRSTNPNYKDLYEDIVK